MDNTPTNTHRRKLLTGAVTLAAAAPLMAGLSACGAASEPETKATAGATAATTTPVANTTPSPRAAPWARWKSRPSAWACRTCTAPTRPRSRDGRK